MFPEYHSVLHPVRCAVGDGCQVLQTERQSIPYLALDLFYELTSIMVDNEDVWVVVMTSAEHLVHELELVFLCPCLNERRRVKSYEPT